MFDSKEALEYHIFQRAGASNDDLKNIRSEIIALAVQRAAMLLHKSTCSSAGIVAGTPFDMSQYTLVARNFPQQQNVSCGANVILMIQSISSMPMISACRNLETPLFEDVSGVLRNKHSCRLHVYSILHAYIIHSNRLTFSKSKQYKRDAIRLQHHSRPWHVDHASCHPRQLSDLTTPDSSSKSILKSSGSLGMTAEPSNDCLDTITCGNGLKAYVHVRDYTRCAKLDAYLNDELIMFMVVKEMKKVFPCNCCPVVYGFTCFQSALRTES